MTQRNWKYSQTDYTTVDNSKRVKSLMALCREQACRSIGCKGQHGSVLAKGGSVVSVGYNKPSYRAFTDRFRIMVGRLLHAEMDCVINVSRASTTDADVYVARIGKSGDFEMSRPCRQCEAGLKFVGVRRVYFSIDNERIGMIKL